MLLKRQGKASRAPDFGLDAVKQRDAEVVRSPFMKNRRKPEDRTYVVQSSGETGLNATPANKT